ncbi:hypothetical protein ACLB2K_010252 [Fragaria x ananassa]
MSAEKLPFVLPAVFTVGPRTEDMEALNSYAKLISNHDKNSTLVQGIIEGETRVLAASMTMEEVFKGTEEFKKEGSVGIGSIKGHEYFSYLGQKIQMDAANQGKVDVAEAKMKREVGSKLRDGQTLQNAANTDLETKIISTQRQGEGKKEEIKVKT